MSNDNTHFDKKLLTILACPGCKGKLTYFVNADSDEELVCRFDRIAYPIKQGVPMLLEFEARTMSLDEFEKVDKYS